MASTLIMVADGIDLLVSAAQAVATIGPIIQKAQAEGRTTLTADEWAQIVGQEDSAEQALSRAIEQARSRSA